MRVGDSGVLRHGVEVGERDNGSASPCAGTPGSPGTCRPWRPGHIRAPASDGIRRRSRASVPAARMLVCLRIVSLAGRPHQVLAPLPVPQSPKNSERFMQASAPSSRARRSSARIRTLHPRRSPWEGAPASSPHARDAGSCRQRLQASGGMRYRRWTGPRCLPGRYMRPWAGHCPYGMHMRAASRPVYESEPLPSMSARPRP